MSANPELFEKPVIGPFTVAFCNLGRNKGEEAVKDAMRMIRRELAQSDTPWVLNLVEMDEGDKGYSDHALLRRLFPKAIKVGMAFKNVVLVGGNAKVSHTISRPGSQGVPHQSPARRIVGARVKLTTGQVEDYSIHLPAGAWNGDRQPAIRALLRTAYAMVEGRFRITLSQGLDRGFNQVYGVDGNTKDLEKLNPRDVNLINSAPDYLRAVPMGGYKVLTHKTWTRKTGIEDHHDALFATISFVPA